jgi:hypothetical protein
MRPSKFGSAAWLRAAQTLTLALTTFLSDPMPVMAADLGTKHAYDIPALPLTRALPQFAEQAEIEILFDPYSATSRVSDPVRGTFTVHDALAHLLEHSGLMFSFTSARSVVVYRPGAPPVSASDQQGTLRLDLGTMSVTAPRLIGGNSRATFVSYAEGAQSDIRRTLMEAHFIASGTIQRIRISAHVDVSGQLYDVEVLRHSSDPIRDTQISVLLTGLQLTQEPPPDLPQPLIFDLELE